MGAGLTLNLVSKLFHFIPIIKVIKRSQSYLHVILRRFLHDEVRVGVFLPLFC